MCCCSVEGTDQVAEATWATYRLFPYEKLLATREVEALAGQSATATTDGLAVPDAAARLITERATYFNSVRIARSEVLTHQAAVERRNASVRGVEQRRQATRFGLHGVHEYKGKFNPQVVRALTNVVDAQADVLIDPFCGSGTSLVEATRLGMDAIGVDRSPMAVFLSTGKTMAIAERDAHALRETFAAFVRDLASEMKEAQQSCAVPNFGGVLPADSEAYLRSWFPQETLAAVAVALRATAIARRRTAVHHLTEVALSSGER